MAGSVNRVFLLGNLCADPDVRSFQNGGKIANLRLATSESWKGRDGERKERTEYHSVVINGDGLVGVVERYLRKGSKIHVEGQIRTRKYQDRDGNDRYSTEIVVAGIGGSLVMLGDPKGGSGGGHERQERRREPDGSQGHSGGFSGGFSDPFEDDLDDLPFVTRNGIW